MISKFWCTLQEKLHTKIKANYSYPGCVLKVHALKVVANAVWYPKKYSVGIPYS